jgi:hypothetical protein
MGRWLYISWGYRRWGISAAVRKVVFFSQGGIVVTSKAVVRRIS